MNLNSVIFFLVSFTSSSFPKNSSFFLGNPQNKSDMSKIRIYVDSSIAETIISSSDFNCTLKNGCWLESDILTGVFYSKVYNYQIGHTPMNLINYQFNKSSSFVYLINDTSNMGSILGFNKYSSFLAYYHLQNTRFQFMMKLKLDPDNVLSFLKETPKNKVFLPENKYGLKISVPWNSPLNNLDLRFCISPIFDFNFSNSSFFVVRNSEFNMWRTFLNENEDKNQNITFSILNEDQQLIGNLSLNIDNLTRADGSLKINGFNDAANECDVITGSLMLKQFNYSLFYQDIQDGFSLVNLIQFSDYKNLLSGFSIWNLITIVLLLAIFLVVCVYGYKYYFMEGSEARVSEEYRALGLEPIELKDGQQLIKS